MNKTLLKYFLFTTFIFHLVGCEQKKESIEEKAKEIVVTQKENVDTLTQKQKVKSIVIRGNKIEVGMLADDLFTEEANGQKIFNEDEHIGKNVIQDPLNSNSLLVAHHYKSENQLIDIIIARTEDPGPYRIKEIIIHTNKLNERNETHKELTFRKVKKVNIADNEIRIGQDAYIPQGRLESFFVKNEGDILSTHDSYYSVEGKTYIITYGPGEDGPYIVTDIKVSE